MCGRNNISQHDVFKSLFQVFSKHQNIMCTYHIQIVVKFTYEASGDQYFPMLASYVLCYQCTPSYLTHFIPDRGGEGYSSAAILMENGCCNLGNWMSKILYHHNLIRILRDVCTQELRFTCLQNGFTSTDDFIPVQIS